VARPPSLGVRSLTDGESFVEIFAVSVDFPFVGAIEMYDGRWGLSIYKSKDWGGECKKFFSRKKKWVSSDIIRSALFEFEV
jgi:hypothetical protein